MESQSETTQTMSALKLPILKTGDYDLWSMRIEQYLTHTYYALWEVIMNGDAPAIASASMKGPIPPKTAEQKLARKNELKEKSTLFGGNKESKKMQKMILKQQYENFTASRSEGLDKTYDNDTSSTNEVVIIAHDFPAARSKGQASSSTYADDVMAPRNQGNRNGDAPKRIVPVETPTNALVVQDGIGSYDWSFQAKEGITNFALMAYTSQGYQIGLESLEARIVVHEKNEVVYEEDIEFLKYDVQVKDISIKDLKNQLEEALKEKEDLKLKLEKFEESRESDVDDSPVNDRFKIGKGFHAVFPPYTGNYMPSRPDLSFAGLDDYVYKTKVSENETSISKTSKDTVEKLKNVRPSAPIIKDWDTDSDNDSVFRPKPNQTKQKFTKINFVKSDKNVKTVNKENTHRQEEYPRKSQSPRDNRRNWNGTMTQKLGNCFKFIKKACFVCESFNHLIKDSCWIWRPTGKVIDHISKDSGSYIPKRFDYVDPQGRLKHMTRNKSYLTNYQDIDGGFVAFAGSPKGGKITRKGKIRTGKLDFEDVYFVKELKFNLFSVSQMCNKKNNILFTETECLVLSPDLFYLLTLSYLMKVKSCLKFPDRTTCFLLATKDETSGILKTFITGIENQINHKVKIIRCDNGTEFKNNDMNQFCEMKGIKREFSVARTPQQNRAEAVSTTCYVQNRVLVTKPHNKTPYELLLGRPPSISFMRLFGCPVTILNTLDPLGKFDEKADEGFFVGYSINNKAFRIFNTRTRKVEENLHINFLENKPNVTGSGPEWLFDIDSLTKSMNYEPVTAGDQTNSDAGIETNVNTGQVGQEKAFDYEYILLPLMLSNSPLSSSSQSTDNKDDDEVPGKGDDDLSERNGQEKEEGASNKEDDQHGVSTINPSVSAAGQGFDNADGQERIDRSTQDVNTTGPSINITIENINTGSSNINTTSPIPNDPSMQSLEATGIFDNAYDDREEVGAEADLKNLVTTMNVSFIPITRIHKDHPIEQIIKDLHSAPLTRRMSQQNLEKLGLTLVDFPKGKRAIGTKWVYRNKKDERGIVVRNKAILVAKGYTQEEGIDYDKVFAPVARIEAIRLFLAYASFFRLIVYQMDVKSAFLYVTIEEEVYVCQPPGFEDPQFPDKVYKVEKALYGLHQAPRAWYETLSTYLFENGYRRGTIDKTLFIKKERGDIQLVQKEDGIFIIQDKYVVDILKKFDFTTVKAASTPIETNKALNKNKEAEDVDVHLYRSMIGSLMYLTASRPDIMFAVCTYARFQVTPKTSHLHAVKRIFRYLKGQPKLDLWYPRNSPFDLEAFSDSDYAGASLDMKSTTRGCQFLGKRLISWQCVMDPKSNA
ncbi:putative ribonuclease H-like domain-containing protein [Tanacetum coccineum]